MPTREEIKDFSMMVEKLAANEKIGLMDAICQHCKNTGLEIEIASTLISSSLKSKITEEAINDNLIKRGNQLPI